jgi:O-antigen/teichoic acid export membrane protein
LAVSEAARGDLARRGVHGVAKMASGRLATQLALMLSALVIPRTLGTHDYGVLAALVAMLSIVQTAVGAGYPIVEARRLAPLWARGPREHAIELGSSIWGARIALSWVGAGALAVWLLLSPELELGRAALLFTVATAILRFCHEASKSLLLPVGRVGSLSLYEFARAALMLPIAVLCFPRFGLEGLLAGMAALHAALLVASSSTLRAASGFRAVFPKWSIARSHLSMNGAGAVAAIAAMVQAQFSVYAVARHASASEAAYLGLAAQLYTLLQTFFLSARRALMPLLSELEARGDAERLAEWSVTLLRYATAGLAAGLITWSLLGDWLVRTLIGERFAPVAPCASWMLVASMCFCGGATCNGLLFVRERPGRAAANSVLYSIATVAGLVLALGGAGRAEGAAVEVSKVYALAAAVFFVEAWIGLGLGARLWLSLGRVGLLALPALLAFGLTGLSLGLGARIALALALVVSYAAAAVALGLLPARELRELRRLLRAPRPAPQRAPDELE